MIHAVRPPAAAPPWWSHAWVPVLAGGLVMGLALGVRHVQGLFLLPVTMDRGWARDAFAFAMAVQNLVWGVAQPFTGMIADRFGSARVVAAGIVLYAVGLWSMTHAHASAAFVWSAGVCVGLALSGTTFGVVYGALSRLVVPLRRSQALGLAGALGGLGQFVMVPAAQGLIGGWGWAVALVVLSIAMAVVVPLALPLDDRARIAAPGPAEQPLREALREAFAHPGFRLLNLGFVACGFQLAFIATHLPAYLVDEGMGPREGMAALAIIALANIAGTYLFGALGGRRSKKRLLAGIYLARSAAMALFVLLPLGAAGLYLFAAVMGLLWLGTVPLTSGLVSQVFGVRYVTTLFGFVFLGHQVGSFLGVWLGGLVFEATGSYDAIWIGAMILGVAAAALHWPIDDREIVRAPAQGVA